LESKNQVALPLATHHADLLRKNWGRMKASILIAESYSG